MYLFDAPRTQLRNAFQCSQTESLMLNEGSDSRHATCNTADGRSYHSYRQTTTEKEGKTTLYTPARRTANGPRPYEQSGPGQQPQGCSAACAPHSSGRNLRQVKLGTFAAPLMPPVLNKEQYKWPHILVVSLPPREVLGLAGLKLRKRHAEALQNRLASIPHR